MREQVVMVVRVDPETEDWEVMGIYVPGDDADNAIAYFERADVASGDEQVYAKVSMPVLSFPGWVK